MLVLGIVWLAAFAVLTVAYSGGHEIGYSGGEWCVYIGCPSWVTGGGFDGYPGFWEGFRRADWSVHFPSLVGAVALPLAPLLLGVLGYLIVKGRFRFHLLTAIALQLAAAGLLWANITVDSKWGAVRWGWPESLDGTPYVGEALLTNISVAVCVLFFTAFACEKWLYRERTADGTQPGRP